MNIRPVLVQALSIGHASLDEAVAAIMVAKTFSTQLAAVQQLLQAATALAKQGSEPAQFLIPLIVEVVCAMSDVQASRSKSLVDRITSTPVGVK
jgi:hypothetical protein